MRRARRAPSSAPCPIGVASTPCAGGKVSKYAMLQEEKEEEEEEEEEEEKEQKEHTSW